MCDTMVHVHHDRILFAKNSDRDANEAQLLEWSPASNHTAGSRARCTWIDIPQVARTRATLVSRPFWMWGAEIGTNDAGVTIGNEAVWTDEPVDEVGLTGMDLLRLTLERADSAEHAVSVLIDLLDTHGQGGGCGHERRSFRYHNSFLVAGPDGAWVVETAGPHSATERVTHGARSISNGLTIAGFADAHADPLHDRVTRCATRRARTQAAAGRATTPLDLMAALRDHGPTALPDYSTWTGALGAPCAHPGGLIASTQTTASWVAELTSTTVRHWATATAAPCTSIFKPVAVDQPLGTDVLGPPPTDRFDPDTVWWCHEALHRTALRDPARWLPLIDERRRPIEDAFAPENPADTPASAAAFAQAAEWEADIARLISPAADRRTPTVRRFWAVRNRRAGVPA